MRQVDSRTVNPLVRRRSPPKIVITHGNSVRTIVVRPWLAGTLAAVGLTFLSLYLAATGYLVFRDDLLAASISRQARIQSAYEDRIAFLRADIDRLTSRQLLNQQAFDEKLERLLGRQAALDARQDIIAGLSQTARRAGLKPTGTVVPTPVPNPLSSGETATGGPLTTGSIETIGDGQRAPLAIAKLRRGRDFAAVDFGPAARIAALEESLDALASEQIAYVEDIADTVSERADRISSILGKLGHPVPEGPPLETRDVGGPLVPLAPGIDPETFRDNVSLIAAEIEWLADVRAKAKALPLAKPAADAEVTSRFGTRLDPFLRRPALHTGTDFRAPQGYPVRATAAGTVKIASYNGGYGKLVEVDHGGGVTTRFGHLSRISAKVGDKVSQGALLGRVGSTGRSTGPHLHYEVRVDGTPVNPMRYILAGSELRPLL